MGTLQNTNTGWDIIEVLTVEILIFKATGTGPFFRFFVFTMD